MSANPLTNAATDSTKGTIYQLSIALQKCFEMTADQSVFVERYGDVTLGTAEQIEVKQYADNLTDNHENFWKTFSNWMQPGFDAKKYSALILCTTQQIGPQSQLMDWNRSDLAGRQTILASIHKESETRYAERCAAAGTTKPPSGPAALVWQREILIQGDADKRNAIIKRLVIVSGNPDLEDLNQRIQELHCKGILMGKRSDFCDGLFGFIVNPRTVGSNGWEITYDQFVTKVADLTSLYCKQTTRFPTKYRRDSKTPLPAGANDQLFVRKIHDINYPEVVPAAVKDYLYASDTVAKDFAAYERPPDAYRAFSQSVLEEFHPLYRLSQRTKKGDLEGAKNFYDEAILRPVPTFPGFETPSLSFRNGVLHMHQNDAQQNLSWKLT